MERIGIEDEVDLRPILKFLIGRLWLIALASILFAAAGAALAYDYDFEPEYSTTRVYVSTSEQGGSIAEAGDFLHHNVKVTNNNGVIYVVATQAKQEDAERLVTNVGTSLEEIAKPYQLNFVATETVITERGTIGRKAVLAAFLGALTMTMVLFLVKWWKNESLE